MEQRAARRNRRSRRLTVAVVGAIGAGPSRARRIARQNIAKALASQPDDPGLRRWAERWESLLLLPVADLATVLLEPGQDGEELRRQTPFASLIDAGVRRAVLEACSAEEAAEGARSLADLCGDCPEPTIIGAVDAAPEAVEPFVVEVVRAVSGRLAVAIPAPAEQVVEVDELHAVEPVARTLLGAALGVPADGVPLLVRVDSLHLPGRGALHTPGRAVLISDADEDSIVAAEQLLQRSTPANASDLARALGSVLQVVRRRV